MTVDVELTPLGSADIALAFGLASVRDPDWVRLHLDRLEGPDTFESQLFAGVHESFVITTNVPVGIANFYRADVERGTVWLEVVMIPELAGSDHECESIRAMVDRAGGQGFSFVLMQSVVSAQPKLPDVVATERVCHIPDYVFADDMHWDVVVDALVIGRA